MPRRFAPVVLSIILAFALPPALFALDLSLKNSFDLALANNDGLKAAGKSRERAEKLRTASAFLYLPSVEILGNYTYINEPPTMEFSLPLSAINPAFPNIHQTTKLSTNNLAYGIFHILYPLYTGGKRPAALNIAALNVEDSAFLADLKRLNLFEELVKTYYGLILNAEILAALEESKAAHRAHLDNAIMLEANAQIAKLERLSAKVAFDKAQNRALQGEDSLQLALLSFKTLLQDEAVANASIEGAKIANLTLTSPLKISQKPLESLDFYQQKVLENYPALKSVETKTKLASELKSLEFSDFLPTVALFGSYTLKDNAMQLNKMLPSWNVGVLARWQILSPNGRIFRYQAAQIAQNEAELLYSQAKKDLSLLTQKTYQEIVFAKDSHTNLQSTLDLAKENLKLQEEAFKHGMSDSAKVSDARNALLAAQIELKNAEYRFVVALAKLCVLTNDIEAFYGFY